MSRRVGSGIDLLRFDRVPMPEDRWFNAASYRRLSRAQRRWTRVMGGALAIGVKVEQAREVPA